MTYTVNFCSRRLCIWIWILANFYPRLSLDCMYCHSLCYLCLSISLSACPHFRMGNALHVCVSDSYLGLFLNQCWPSALVCCYHIAGERWFNLSPPGQDVCHFADDILRCDFLNTNFWLKFHWILFLRVQLTITQHLFGAKPLSEPMLTPLTEIYVALVGDKLIITWIKTLVPSSILRLYSKVWGFPF